MAVFERMFKASFKGADFLITGSVETAGGRKLVDHLYPNSPRRFIEDLGQLREDFTMTGIIREPRYHSKRDLLKKKLEEGGAGQLVHPFLGKFNVVAKPYVLLEDTTQMGRAEFQLTFAVADNNVFPEDGGANKFVKFLDDIQDGISSLLDGAFGADAAANFGPAGALLTDIVDSFDAIQRTIAVTTDGVNAFQDELVQFKNKINSFVQGVENLGLSLNSLFNNFGTITDNALDKVKSFENLFGFSSTPRIEFSKTIKFGVTKKEDEPILLLNTDIVSADAPVTEDNLSKMQALGNVRQENLRNANSVNVSMNVSSLSQMYFAAQQIEFETDIELIDVSDRLENSYQQVVPLIENELLESLNNMRNEWNRFVNIALLSIDQVIEIEVGPTNVTKLVYSLYGSTERYEQIIDLNEITNPSEISGIIRVIAS